MEDLLPYFERELVILRRDCKEFAERFPKIASRLQVSGDTSEDPHVERLIQAVALLAARVSKRLDDDYPQFTEALLETLFPHYLRPFPSCAIVQVDTAAATTAGMSAMSTIARGTEMEGAPVNGVRCKFKTVYDIVTGPVVLSRAEFLPLIKAPANIKLAPGASSMLAITISSTTQSKGISSLAIDTLRV